MKVCICQPPVLICTMTLWRSVKLSKHLSIAANVAVQIVAQPASSSDDIGVHCWRSRGGTRNSFRRWHGPARVAIEGQHGYWLIDNGTPILCAPNLMRQSTLNEIQGRRQDELGQPPGQRAFADVRGAQHSTVVHHENRHEHANKNR